MSTSIDKTISCISYFLNISCCREIIISISVQNVYLMYGWLDSRSAAEKDCRQTLEGHLTNVSVGCQIVFLKEHTSGIHLLLSFPSHLCIARSIYYTYFVSDTSVLSIKNVFQFFIGYLLAAGPCLGGRGYLTAIGWRVHQHIYPNRRPNGLRPPISTGFGRLDCVISYNTQVDSTWPYLLISCFHFIHLKWSLPVGSFNSNSTSINWSESPLKHLNEKVHNGCRSCQ